MSFYEKFDLMDNLFIKGHVIIKDNKTNKIIVDKDNMILADAKRLLLQNLLRTDENSISFLKTEIPKEISETANYKLIGMDFYSTNDEVIYNETSKDKTYRIIFGAEDIDKSQTEVTLEDLGDGHYRMKFAISLGGFDEPTVITSLGLIMGSDGYPEATNENYEFNTQPIKSFSRIKFDPIVISEESSLNLTYYVYF